MTLEPAKMERAAEQASRLLRTLANERRLLILCEIAQGEKSVGELAELIGIDQSPLSQHLARLRREKIVRTRRESQTIFYALADATAERILKTLYDIYCAPAADPNPNDRQ
jgi:DNA-binding transcriptional ArsR family regulator